MNCTTTQRRLLAAERPDRPDGEVRAHLAQCPACRAVQRRLVQVERQIPQLPVPPSSVPPAFLRTLLDDVADTPAPVRLPLRPSLPGAQVKERALKKLALAIALAAALLVFAVGWWAWPHHGPGPVGPVVAETDYTLPHRANLDRRLREAHTPADRVRAVAAVVEAVQREALDPAADPVKLAQLANYYAGVVGEDLMKHARALPAAERRAVLVIIADGMGRFESEAERRAADPRAARKAAALHTIARAARKGDRHLRALSRGEPA